MNRRDFIEKGAFGTVVTLGAFKSINEMKLSDPVITEPAREIPVIDEYDIIVCGGGPAGVSAAVSAGRSGARTL